MAIATIEKEIKADVKKVFDVITNFESYPEFLKETKGVVVEKKSKTGAIVTFEVDVIKTIHYTLDMKLKAPHHVTWTLVKGDFMKSNVGGWDLEEIKKGVTLAKYHIEVKFGLLVPGSVADTLVKKSLPAMIESFKKRIEKG